MTVAVREMHRTRMFDHPQWEISVVGRVVGWVRVHKIARSSVMFYEATGIDPDGNHVILESSGDREQRIETVVAFDRDPEPWRNMPLASTELSASMGIPGLVEFAAEGVESLQLDWSSQQPLVLPFHNFPAITPE